MKQNINLTKTDFIQFLNCPKSLWLLKNKPEEYPIGEFSLFLEKLIKDGYEVEEYAMKLFPGGIDLGNRSSVEETKKAIEGEGDVFFQPSFETKDGVFARVDILEKNVTTEIMKNRVIRNFQITQFCPQQYVQNLHILFESES